MGRNHVSGTVATIVLATMVAGSAVGDEPTFRSSSGSMRTNLDCETKARLFPAIDLALFRRTFFAPQESENSVRCTARLRNGGDGVRGVRVNLGGRIFLDDSNAPIQVLPPTSGKTRRDGNLVIDFPLGDLPDDDLSVIIEGTFGTKKKADSAEVECTLRNRMPCEEDQDTICLLDDRFQVEVDWRDFDNSTGPGQVQSSGRDSGSFYFFNPNNQSLLVQLLDVCSNNDHFWVFAQASTNVEYDLTVTDTETGASRVYQNELGQAAPAITDTSAFATCP